MNQTVVFKTPGLIPIEAFTMMGVNSKPSVTNPIGHFGTGLKYAIAVLVREGCVITLWIGLDKYTFYKDKKDFRGKEFDFIAMKLEKHRAGQWLKPRITHLPFTTELGKNWELWMAFRELHSNTLDENGTTYLAPEDTLDRNFCTLKESYFERKDTTQFVVGSAAFAQVYRDRDKYFLPDGLKVQEQDAEIQVLDRPSQHVYYRGLMVHELKVPSQFTYNILRKMDLTEDRTIKFPHMIDVAIANHVRKSEDAEYISKTVKAPIGSYERKLEYDYSYASPSKTFIDVASKSKPGDSNEGAVRVAKSLLPKPKTVDPFAKFPRPWTIDIHGVISDANGQKLWRLYSATGMLVDFEQLTVDAVNGWKVPDDYRPTVSVGSGTLGSGSVVVEQPPTALDMEIPF